MARAAPELLQIPDVATALAVSRPTVYRLIRSGTLRAIRIPGVRDMRVTRAEVERFLRTEVEAVEPFGGIVKGSRRKRTAAA